MKRDTTDLFSPGKPAELLANASPCEPPELTQERNNIHKEETKIAKAAKDHAKAEKKQRKAMLREEKEEQKMRRAKKARFELSKSSSTLEELAQSTKVYDEFDVNELIACCDIVKHNATRNTAT